jgi:hypothetical protein
VAGAPQRILQAGLAALLLAGVVTARSAEAIPPPPEREARRLRLTPGRVLRVEDRVLAYDHPVFSFEARAGERLLLRLDDPGSTLMLALEAPSGARVLEGARPAAGGMAMLLNESGRWRAVVQMEGDAARSGARAGFALTLERR